MDEKTESESPSLHSGARRGGKSNRASSPDAVYYVLIPAIAPDDWLVVDVRADTGLAAPGSYVSVLVPEDLDSRIHVSEGKIVRPGLIRLTFTNLGSVYTRPIECEVKFRPIEKRSLVPEIELLERF